MSKIKDFFGLGNFLLTLKDSINQIDNRLKSHENEIISSKNNDLHLAKELSEIRRIIEKMDYRITRIEDNFMNNKNYNINSISEQHISKKQIESITNK